MNYTIIALLIIAIVLDIVVIIKATKKTDDGKAEMLNQNINSLSQSFNQMTKANYENQMALNETISKKLDTIRVANAEQSETQSKRVDTAIRTMQESNEKKLEEMRKTVDEKLTETLNNRLNASFKTVSEQLQNVYKSLGEMKELSTGVTDNVKGLNKILTNVKSRGTWAEVQLGNLLDETIPCMYETNVKTNPKYNGQIEFAIKIPSAESDEVTYLPVDSKFPMEDYARLSSAADNGDLIALESAKKALETRIKDEAKLIKQYISVPETTPFAIMYLATEGLYAEVMSSKTGLAEKLQKEGIMVAGPSTIIALLNSLSMGFRTMAINQKANEVWKILGAAKAQYEKFGTILAKAKKKIDEAGKTLDEADHRNEIIQKNLKDVEKLEFEDDGDNILGIE